MPDQSQQDQAQEQPDAASDFADTTAEQVGLIGSNLLDTVSEVVDTFSGGLIQRLDHAVGLDGSAPDRAAPPPDVVPATPVSHDAVKQAAEQAVPSPAGSATNLHDQLEQAKSQMQRLGKPPEEG